MKRDFVVVAALMLFATSALGASPTVKPSPDTPVSVTNTSANPVPVTGTVTQSGTWAVQTIKDAYTETGTPTCDAANDCQVVFSPVPAGRILRVTNVQAFARVVPPDSFLVLHTDTASSDSAHFIIPLTFVNAVFYGTVGTANVSTDMVFEAGQHPVLEIGSAGSFTSSTIRLGITGTLYSPQ